MASNVYHPLCTRCTNHIYKTIYTLKENMKISIIVPLYNVEDYVEECFSSIVRQTYAGSMECIFVDDCGTDGSVALVEKLIATYRGTIELKMVHHERNKGLSAARNTGLREATGDYVFFIDSDDSIVPECIALMAELAEKYQGVDMVQGNLLNGPIFLRIDENILHEFSSDHLWIRKKILTRKIPQTAWNKLVRREFILQNNLFFAEGLVREDELWTFFLSKHLKSVAFSFEHTYNYRTNLNGIMSKEKDNPNSTIPIVHVMASNLSKPLVFHEINYMLLLTPDILYTDALFLQELGRYRSFVLQWHRLPQICLNTTKYSLRGFWARLSFRVLSYFFERDIFL